MKSEAGLEPMLIGRYSKPSTTLYLHINDDFVKISNKKDLLLLFISKKKEISRFIQRNRINFKHANNSQLINLLKYCDDISSKPNNEE